MGTQATVEIKDLHLGGIMTTVRHVEGGYYDETGEWVDTMVPQLVARFDCGWLPSYCDDALVFDCRNINHQFLAEMDRKKIPYVKG